MAPQLAGKIISALACDKGYGVKNSTASVANYLALKIFSEKGLSNLYSPNAKFTESYIYYFQTSVATI